MLFRSEMLRASSELAGFDARNMTQNMLVNKGVPTAQDDKPVLVMRSLVEKQKREAEALANPRTPEKADEDWAEIEKLFAHIGTSKNPNATP